MMSLSQLGTQTFEQETYLGPGIRKYRLAGWANSISLNMLTGRMVHKRCGVSTTKNKTKSGDAEKRGTE
jgi:hypothetical protein